jgi:hypothetical protein
MVTRPKRAPPQPSASQLAEPEAARYVFLPPKIRERWRRRAGPKRFKSSSPQKI